MSRRQMRFLMAFCVIGALVAIGLLFVCSPGCGNLEKSNSVETPVTPMNVTVQIETPVLEKCEPEGRLAAVERSPVYALNLEALEGILPPIGAEFVPVYGTLESGSLGQNPYQDTYVVYRMEQGGMVLGQLKVSVRDFGEGQMVYQVEIIGFTTPGMDEEYCPPGFSEPDTNFTPFTPGSVDYL